MPRREDVANCHGLLRAFEPLGVWRMKLATILRVLREDGFGRFWQLLLEKALPLTFSFFSAPRNSCGPKQLLRHCPGYS